MVGVGGVGGVGGGVGVKLVSCTVFHSKKLRLSLKMELTDVGPFFHPGQLSKLHPVNLFFNIFKLIINNKK